MENSRHIGSTDLGPAFTDGSGSFVTMTMRLPDGWPDGVPVPAYTALYANGDGTCSPRLPDTTNQPKE